MNSDILTNRRMAILVALVQLALLAGLILYPNFVIAVAAIITFFIAAVVWRFGFLIKPIITRQANVMEGFGKYEIPPSQDLIIKKEGNRYYATTYMLVRFAHSSTDKTPEQVAAMRQSYERAISSLNYVCKLSSMVCPVDISPHIERIKERRSNAETRLSEVSSLPASANQGAEMARLKREIESYSGQLERIQSGERPMRVINFVMTCASGSSKDEAMTRVKQQAAELKTVLASTLDTEILPLAGDELKRCFEWEFTLPEKEKSDDFLY